MGGGASDIDEWTEEELNEELKKLPGFIERKKARVKRETFDAMNTSPLVRHYITSISDSSVRAFLPSVFGSLRSMYVYVPPGVGASFWPC